MSGRDTILDYANRLRCTDNRRTQQNIVKRLILDLWRILPVEHRRKFLGHVAVGYPHDFLEWEKRFPKSDDAQLEEVARHWCYVMTMLDGDDLAFGKSFERLIRLQITPSEKQAAWAKRLYSEWKKYRGANIAADKDEIGGIIE